MEVKVVQVATPPGRQEEFVVIVPNEYENSACSISAVTKAMKQTRPAAWTIVRESDVVTLNI